MATPHAVFLDATVLGSQVTTEVMLSIAHGNLYRPRWSAEVLDEVKRNRGAEITDERADSHFAHLTEAFPYAVVSHYEHLVPEMQADEPAKKVLAAAVAARARVLVTENISHFHAPTTGPYGVTVERTSQFLGRLLDEKPPLVVEAIDRMVARHRQAPQTMPELIGKLLTQQDLKAFADKLNAVVL